MTTETKHEPELRDIAEKTKIRFWDKVDMRGPDECWPWIGNVSGRGYGRFFVRGRNYAAHRFSVLLTGRPIPAGLVADHICRNRLCVNPSHIRAVTTAVNSTENSISFAAKNKRKTHCPAGHVYSVENTRIQNRRDGSVSRCCKTCQRKHWNNHYARKRAAALGEQP